MAGVAAAIVGVGFAVKEFSENSCNQHCQTLKDARILNDAIRDQRVAAYEVIDAQKGRNSSSPMTTGARSTAIPTP